MAPSYLLLIYTKITFGSGWIMANPPGIPISESSPLITSDFDEPPAALLTTLAFDIERHTNGQLDDQAFTLTGFEFYSCWEAIESSFYIVLKRGEAAGPSTPNSPSRSHQETNTLEGSEVAQGGWSGSPGGNLTNDNTQPDYRQNTHGNW